MNRFNKNTGSALIATLIVVGVLLTIFGVLAMAWVNAANYGNRAEVSLEKVWKNNQNILGQYTIKVQEVASVPEIYKNDLKEIITAEMSGRYGKDGSKANMQWIKERSQNFDNTMYQKIQQVMEAGRNEFQNSQTRLIDEKAVYETELGRIGLLSGKFWLSLAGYPKVDLAKYKPIVAKDTQQQFETGVGGPVKLR